MEYHNIIGQNDVVNDVPLAGRHLLCGPGENRQYRFAASIDNNTEVTLLPQTDEELMKVEALTAWHSATDHYQTVSSALNAGMIKEVGRTIGNIAACSHDIMACLFHYIVATF